MYDGIKVYAPRPNAYEIDYLSNVISDIIIEIDPGHECSCDLSALSAKVDELSSELSNRWKCGGVYDDNCYGYSIGDSSQYLAIDLDNGEMWYGDSTTLNWHACELYGFTAGTVGPGYVSLNWNDRHLYDDTGNLAIRWSDRILHDSSQRGALDWENRTLYDSDTHIVADWERKQLLDTNTIPAVDWSSRILYDSQSNESLNWFLRQLKGDWSVQYGSLTIDGTATFKIGNTSLSEAQLSALLALI